MANLSQKNRTNKVPVLILNFEKNYSTTSGWLAVSGAGAVSVIGVSPFGVTAVGVVTFGATQPFGSVAGSQGAGSDFPTKQIAGTAR